MMNDETKTRGIALFDMDQTLVQWDTQLLFCNWVLRHEPMRRSFLLIFLPFLPLARVLGSEGMKRIFLSFLWGMRRERLDELVAGFVEHYVPGEFYPEVLDIELVDGKLPDSAGYSDSKADLPMLELCEEITAIHPEGSYAERAREEGWRIMRPQRLWKDRREFAWACLRMVVGAFPPR